MHVEGGQRWKIEPFRKFILCDFPSKQLKDLFRFEWKPIFAKMMETPGLRIPTDECKIDNAFVQSSYASAMRFLCKNYSYIFNRPEGSTDNF